MKGVLVLRLISSRLLGFTRVPLCVCVCARVFSYWGSTSSADSCMSVEQRGREQERANQVWQRGRREMWGKRGAEHRIHDVLVTNFLLVELPAASLLSVNVFQLYTHLDGQEVIICACVCVCVHTVDVPVSWVDVFDKYNQDYWPIKLTFRAKLIFEGGHSGLVCKNCLEE